MQKIIFYTVIMLFSFVGKSIAQEKSFESRAKEIASKIEKVTTEQKKALKTEIEAIDKQVIEGKITKEKAEELRLASAKEKAIIIDKQVAIEEDKLNQLIQDKVDGKFAKNSDLLKKDSIVVNGKKYEVTYTVTDSTDVIYDIKRILGSVSKNKSLVEKRTTSQFVFAFGLNNVITEGENLKDSDFRVAGSHFYEWGFTFNSRIVKNNNLLHAKYGASLMYNNLRPTDNRLFVKNGNQTELQTASVNLDDSRLRNVQLVFPVHLEFDFTPKKLSEDGSKTYFRTHKSFRVGLGGYGGFNVKTKQITKYERDGDNVKDKQKGNFNTSNFVYGLSTYVGYRATSLYLKYDINPLFKNNTIDQNNISLGLRFDFN